MLTDRQLEYISDALVPLFQYLESEVIADVTQRVKATTAYTRTAEQQAQAMHALGYSPSKIRKEVMRKLNADPEYRKLVAKNTLEHKKTVRNLLKKIKKEAFNASDKIFAQVGDLSFLDDLRIWKLGNKAITDNSFLPKLIEAISMQTKGELKNLTRTTGFRTVAGMESLESLYKKELDQVMIKITSGTFSQEQAIYDCIHNLANSGLRTIDFGSGRSMQLDTAVRLATRTGASQLMGQIAVQSINDTDTGMVYVSTHWGARNTGKGHANHAQWQGKVYTVNAKAAAGAKEEAKRIGQDKIEDLWEVTGYSVDGSHANDPLGLYGYNCRHRIYPWFEGISSLPDEDPEPAPVEIDGKKYDYYAMSQKQRAKESRIRALKREREAQTKAGLDTTEINKKIKTSINEYTMFCKKYGMNPTNRVRYDNGTGDYSKTRAWKEYEKKRKEDIERLENIEKGALNDLNDPDYSKREQAAKIYYESIRNSKKAPIVNKIVNNTGYSEEKVSKAIDHLFYNKYNLRKGLTYFDEDYDIFQSVQRLREGKNIQAHDLILLEHESYEYDLMNNQGMSYEQAHKEAEQKYNYAKELFKYLEER
ncbi:MAG: phage minor capsid protein [Lachnospiraceae bacterium]|nr:phage minor capsid protein [Lachnospiraceae bacterium]